MVSGGNQIKNFVSSPQNPLGNWCRAPLGGTSACRVACCSWQSMSPQIEHELAWVSDVCAPRIRVAQKILQKKCTSIQQCSRRHTNTSLHMVTNVNWRYIAVQYNM